MLKIFFQIYNQTADQSHSGWHLNELDVEIPSIQLAYKIPCDIWVTNRNGAQGSYFKLPVTDDYLVKYPPSEFTYLNKISKENSFEIICFPSPCYYL